MSDSVDVLELRIHGVNNMRPGMCLSCRGGDCQYEGDSLGSFWHPVPSAQTSLPPSNPGLVPSGVQREAYSRGGMPRNSIGESSRIGKVLSGAAPSDPKSK